MDEDGLKHLDRELEGDEDDEAFARLEETFRLRRAGEVERALDIVEGSLLQAETEPVADERVTAMLLLQRGRIRSATSSS